MLHSQLQGQNGHLTVKSQKNWSTSYFEATNIIWSILDHDSQSMAQKVSRCKSFYFWTTEKSTANWPRHNFFMVHQKNSIQCSFWREWHFLQLIFTLQAQEMLSQKVINLNIIGHFQKSTKRHFKSKTITWDWWIKMTWDQRHWLEDFKTFPKCPRTCSYDQNWARYALEKLGNFCEMAKVNYPWNFIFDKKGPTFSTWFSFAMPPTCPMIYFKIKN